MPLRNVPCAGGAPRNSVTELPCWPRAGHAVPRPGAAESLPCGPVARISCAPRALGDHLARRQGLTLLAACLEVRLAPTGELADAVLRVAHGADDRGRICGDTGAAQLRGDHPADERVQLLHL